MATPAKAPKKRTPAEIAGDMIDAEYLAQRDALLTSILAQDATPTARTGAPTKLDAELIRQICYWISLGSPLNDVCDILSIPISTFYDWMERGEDPARLPYALLSESVKTAQGLVKNHALQGVRARVSGWQALAWFLERRYQSEYALKPPSSHASVNIGKIEVSFSVPESPKPASIIDADVELLPSDGDETAV